MRKTLVLLIALLSLPMVPGMAGEGDIGAKIKQISEGEHRSDQNKARNRYRNPVETLQFFGIKEDMTVVEISPGGGWYFEILAPLLAEKGKYIAAGRNPAKRLEKKIQAHSGLYAKVESRMFSGDELDPGAEGSADMVLTFRNVHNWMGGGNVTQVFESFYKVLKPGGILGLVEHRGNGSEQDPKGQNGYVNQDYMIKLAENAGFILVASSEINSNAKDTKNHPSGVWSLPPTHYKQESDADKAKYKAIGESDRATLKFVKP